MKRQYVKPIIIGEEFVADECVSACWGIACKEAEGWGIGPALEPHRKETCGTKSHQSIRLLANGNYEVAEVEHDLTEQDLACKIYPNGFSGAGYDSITAEQLEASRQNNNGTLYWTTRLYGVTYYHNGIISLENADKNANHS